MKAKIANPGKYLVTVIFFASLLGLVGCSDEKSVPQNDSAKDAEHKTNATTNSNEKLESKQTLLLEGDEKVLATVAGTAISEYDVKLFINSTFSEDSSKKIDSIAKDKILKSMVQSRSIAISQEKAMAEHELAELNKKINAYKEQLLVKQYLAANVVPEPVTSTMIKQYYALHPEKFGAKSIKTFELIKSKSSISATERDLLLTALKDNEVQSNWKELTQKLQQSGYPVTYSQGESSGALLLDKLKVLIKSLKKGQVSQPTIIEGSVYIVKVTGERITNPRPLNDVSAEIRKMLLPIQLKKAVKKVAENVMGKIDIKYSVDK